MGEDSGKARRDKSTSNNKQFLIRDVLTGGRFWLAHCEWAARHTQDNTILLEKAVSNSSYKFHLSFISYFHLNHKTILSFFLSFFPFYTIMLLDNPRSVLKDWVIHHSLWHFRALSGGIQTYIVIVRV